MKAMARASITVNPQWRPGGGLDESRVDLVDAYHRSIPGFRPTPLIEQHALADVLDCSRVFVKHESERLGLPSFKIVGASWAINCAIAGRLGFELPRSFAETIALVAGTAEDMTLTAATDGNHGRAVAHIGRLLNLPARIYVPKGMAPSRVSAIVDEGAEVVVVNGSYDETVRAAASEANEDATYVLVSDTSWPGYEEVPLRVVEGYSTIFREASRQLREAGQSSVDVAFIPAGVGALATAAVNALNDRDGAVVTVEPCAADCLRRSIEAGTRVTVPGPHESVMAGLNCGEVSYAAWTTLRNGVRASVAVTDDESIAAVRMLAALGIRSGASGAAALAGAIALTQSSHRQAIYGGKRSGVTLLLNSEGVTDPERYAAMVD
jgi:diaminopropionate ammonia-lyase